MIEKFRDAILKKRAEFDAMLEHMPKPESVTVSPSVLPLIDQEIAATRAMQQQLMREFEELSAIAGDAIHSGDDDEARRAVEVCQRVQELFERTKASLEVLETLRERAQAE